jgi:hypothetical protein
VSPPTPSSVATASGGRNDGVARRRVDHRLVAEGGKVEDREAAKSEAAGISRPVAKRKLLAALVVGPAMHHGAHHRPHGRFDRVATASEHSGNAAHGFSGF